MSIFKKRGISFLVLAADIGVLIPINYINIAILTHGGVTLFENNLLIITIEVVGTMALTAFNVIWLLSKFRSLARNNNPKPVGI